jgi:hypothetical protein
MATGATENKSFLATESTEDTENKGLEVERRETPRCQNYW